MSYTIKAIGEHIEAITAELNKLQRESRFKFYFDINWGHLPTIFLRQIRLKEGKPYCGNHPGPCLLDRKHRKSNCLEGADWVEFNDNINDLLDKLGIAANVASSVCIVRRGKARCVEYTGIPGREWDKYGVYEDRVGKAAKPSKFPTGTPGEYQNATS